MVESASNDKIRLAVVCKDKNSELQMDKQFKDAFRTRTTWIGGPDLKRFEAAVVCVDEQDDVELVSDLLVRYQNCPVVAFFSTDSDAQITPEEEFKNSKVFHSAEECSAHIKQAVDGVKQEINKVFNEFDSDNSGFIEKNELQQVVAKLGMKMTDSDVDNMINDLDYNKDGKISPDEFHMWWLAGRKGSTGTFSQLLSAGIGGGHFLKSAGTTFKYIADQASKMPQKKKSSSLEFNFNGNEMATDGNQFYLKHQFMGKDTKTAVSEVRGLCGGDSSHSGGIKLSFTFKEGFNVAKLIEFGSKHSVLQMAEEKGMSIKLSCEGNTATVAVLFKTAPFKLGANFEEEVVELVKTLAESQEASQSVTGECRLGFNIADMFAEDAEPIPHYLMKGFSEKLKVDLWSGVVQILMKKLQEDEEFAGEFFQSKLMGMIPLFMAQVNGAFEAALDAEAIAEVLDMPQAEMAKVNVHQLVSGMSPWGTIDDLELIQKPLDEDDDCTPLWFAIDGNEEFETEQDAVNALIDIFVDALNFDVNNQEEVQAGMEKLQETFEKERRTDVQALLAHALSMVIDDNIEVEAGICDEGMDLHSKCMARGSGIGNLLKAAMIAKNIQ